MDNANVPIGAIQRIMGHENRTTTGLYLHSLGDFEHMAMAVYEQASSQAGNNGKVSKSHTAMKEGLDLLVQAMADYL